MKNSSRVLFLLIALLALGAGCGRPTYDLTVWIVDEDRTAVSDAYIALGDDVEDVYTPTETGEVMWTGLEESVVAFTVHADRFLSKSVQVSLDRGPNEMVVVLQDDPVVIQSKGP